jgi:hypothetical protein
MQLEEARRDVIEQAMGDLDLNGAIAISRLSVFLYSFFFRVF